MYRNSCALFHTVTSDFERPLLYTLDQLEKSLKDEQEQHYFEVFSSLTLALQAKDARLYKHSRRVQHFARQLASAIGLPRAEQQTIELAALFHDIGKVGLHDNVLEKPARLTDLEYDYVKEHPVRGSIILTQSRALSNLAPFVRYHHERWDGSGYPFGLQGEAIPPGARIIAIADSFEAITAHRVYQSARTPLWALEEMRRCAGSHFDPTLVETFCTTVFQSAGQSGSSCATMSSSSANSNGFLSK